MMGNKWPNCQAHGPSQLASSGSQEMTATATATHCVTLAIAGSTTK